MLIIILTVIRKGIQHTIRNIYAIRLTVIKSKIAVRKGQYSVFVSFKPTLVINRHIVSAPFAFTPIFQTILLPEFGSCPYLGRLFAQTIAPVSVQVKLHRKKV